jgi:hypothetical protein
MVGVGIKVVGLGVRGWIRAVVLIGLFVCVLNWVRGYRGTPYQPTAPERELRGFGRMVSTMSPILVGRHC